MYTLIRKFTKSAASDQGLHYLLPLSIYSKHFCRSLGILTIKTVFPGVEDPLADIFIQNIYIYFFLVKYTKNEKYVLHIPGIWMIAQSCIRLVLLNKKALDK